MEYELSSIYVHTIGIGHWQTELEIWLVFLGIDNITAEYDKQFKGLNSGYMYIIYLVTSEVNLCKFLELQYEVNLSKNST